MSGEFGQLNGASASIDAANPLPVAVISGGGGPSTVAVSSVAGTVATQANRSATGTPTTVAGNASSVTLLAANAARLGATIVNDSSAILYLLLKTGGTASSSVYTYQLPPAGTVPAVLELPFGYTGDVIGIWASATGNARVTEFTA